MNGALKVAIRLSAILFSTSAHAHDIYSGIHGRGGQLCCGGDDCAATVWREKGGDFEFLTREKTWVAIPAERITFLPIPGDSDEDADPHRGHLCYRAANQTDRADRADNVFGDIYLYCAFIPPGGV